MSTIVTGRSQRLLVILSLIFVFGAAFSISLGQMTMLLMVAFLFGYAISTKTWPQIVPLRWFYLAVATYVGWLILACVAGGDFLSSLSNMREEWLFLIVPAGFYFLQDEKHRDRLAVALAIGVTINAVYGFVVLWSRIDVVWEGGLKIIAGDLVRMHGSFSHALTYGNLNAVAAVFLLGYALSKEHTFASWSGRLTAFGGFMAVFSTLMSNSRGPLAAMIGGLLLLVFFVRRRYLPVTVATVLIVVGTIFSVDGISKRFGEKLDRHMTSEFSGGRRFIWAHAWMVVEANPVIGVGPGNFAQAYQEQLPEGIPPHRYYRHAHNDLLNVTAISGIPGGLIFAAMWLVVLGYLWLGYRRTGPGTPARQIATAALLASLVFAASSLTESTFSDEEPRTLLMFVWAAGLTVWYKQKSVE